MSKRTYNIYFHTHTVSGIVISVALYIIFFAGAFALFKDEIKLWEKGEYIAQSHQSIDIDKALTTIQQANHELYGRDIRIVIPEVNDEAFVSLSRSQDTLMSEKARQYAYFNLSTKDYTLSKYYSFYSLGEFLYRLHFFNQIPTYGIYIAGFVAFFFLFAIVTGVIVHWKKMVSNFFVFRPKAKLKTIWTDAHTALGVIGLPFQFVYAVTSCFFCLSFLVLLPANFLYDNDQQQLMEDLRPMSKTYPITTKADSVGQLNDFLILAQSKWEHFEPKQIYIRNYGATNMKFQIDGTVKDQFSGHGRIIYDVTSKTITAEKNPYEVSYLESVELTMRRLHFADYGGQFLKLAYFLLALITCFVIITGVLIWLEARNKKNIPAKRRRFNAKIGYSYLAICLSLYPVTALSFIVAKLIPRTADDSRETIIYSVFFLTWLIASIILSGLRNNYQINKTTLLSGAILGGLIPIINGLSSGNWLWKTIANQQLDIALIDALWLGLTFIASIILFKMTPRPNVKPAIFNQPTHNKNSNTESINNQTTTNMNIKASLLWLFLVIGFILHHIYGLFGVYYNESVMMEGATGEVPFIHHLYRILFEGMALVFCLCSLEITKRWYLWLAFIWSILLGLFNIYHVITAFIYEPSNCSEILILLWMVLANALLVSHLKKSIR